MGTREGEGTGPSCSGGSIARARISCACRRLVPVWAHACPTCVYSTTFWSTPALYTARASLLTQRVSTSAPAVWLWKVAPGIGIRVRASKKVTRPVESPVTSVPSRKTATLHTMVCSCRFFSSVRRERSWPVIISHTAAVEFPRPPRRNVSVHSSSTSLSSSSSSSAPYAATTASPSSRSSATSRRNCSWCWAPPPPKRRCPP